jgi:hypothetical protein
MPSYSVSFRHVRRLTDDTGILEHSLGSIPRRKEGYSTDDQARALWMCLEWLDLIGNTESEHSELLYSLLDRYLSFLLWVQNEDGHFHNNITYERTKEPEIASDDCFGRCVWACALCYVKMPDWDRQLAAIEILENALGHVETLQYPRGWAYTMAAVSLLLRSGYAEKLKSGSDRLKSMLEMLVEKLLHRYQTNRKPDWHWFEPAVTYGNGVLPWGLLCAYEVLKRDQMLSVAKESLDFLIRLMVNENQQIRPVGNRGWCTPGSRAMWDQQPLDVMKLALACAKAYEITDLSTYKAIVEACRQWFYGANDLGVPMVNVREGSCCDGLCEHTVNRNQGAESTISFLLTEAMYYKTIGGNKEEERYASCNSESVEHPDSRLS